MSQPGRELSASDTWPDFVLPTAYHVDLDGLSEQEREAAVTAIEEIVRPLRSPSAPETKANNRTYRKSGP